MPRSLIIKRSITIAGNNTSVSIEAPFWDILKAVATRRNMTLEQVILMIDRERKNPNRSSALRLYALEFVQSQLTNTTG